MRSDWRAITLALGIGTFVLAAAVAPFVSHPAYSSLTHTVSELAGQSMPHAWIMRTGFVAFGGAVLAVALAGLRGMPSVNGALCLLAAGMIGSAVWSHVPIPEVGGGSRTQDDLHTLAASLMGVGFAAACAARAWIRWAGPPEAGSRIDWSSLAGLAITVVVPLLMVQLPSLAGALQRGMFAFSFVWIASVLIPSSTRRP
jgi:hypothetical protein